MLDKNGKKLNVGDDFYCSRYGFCTVVSLATTDNGEYMRAESVTNGGSFGYDNVTYREEMIGAYKVRSWKELAQAAISVQDACNLSGVVISFGTIISEVRARLESEGAFNTDIVNTHPVCVLFSDKIAHLTKTQAFGAFGARSIEEAYSWAYDKLDLIR